MQCPCLRTTPLGLQIATFPVLREGNCTVMNWRGGQLTWTTINWIATAFAVAFYILSAIGPSPAVRTILSGIAVFLLITPLAVTTFQQSRTAKAFTRWLTDVSRALENPGDLSNANSLLGKSAFMLPSQEAAQSFINRIIAIVEEMEAIKHAHTAAEVRARRMAMAVQKLNVLLDFIPTPILLVTKRQQVELANSAARVLFGSIDGSIGDAISSGLVSVHHEFFERLAHLKTNESSFDWEFRPESGEPLHYRVTVKPLPGDGSASSTESPVLAVILQDISPLADLRKRHAEFVSAVSHEMKAPLAGIKAYVELLADGEVDDEQTKEEFVATIQAQTERLQRLVENLLNLARIEAGIMKVKKQTYSLNEILEDAGRIMRPHAEQKSIALQLELSPLYLGVVADRDLLLQAAINLLSNAIKYTAEGGRVTLRSRMEESTAVFEVEDTGVGLSPEDCERIFDRFYRVEAHRSMAPGTGLGLTLTKHIVEDVHCGRISVWSELGKGSTFRVELPRAVHPSAQSPRLARAVG